MTELVIINNMSIIIYSSLVIALLLNHNRKCSVIICIAIAVVSPKLSNVSTLIRSLGEDSVSEGLNFSTKEAFFYIETLSEILEIDKKPYVITLVSIVFISSILYLIPKFFQSITKKTYLLAIGFLSAVFIYKIQYILTESTLQHNKIEKNFNEKNQFDNMTLSPKNDIDVIVYIGESTSKSHMSAYGYFRKTTPFLDSLKKENEILIFDDVFSTHSHTSPSLLEALSVANKEFPTRLETIYNRKRVSIIEILKKASIDTYLYSNQNPTGTYSHASSIIFGKSTYQLHNKNGLTTGNISSRKSTLKFDSDFISKNIDDIIKNNGVTFFHSYSGHGNYCKNIPRESRVQIDNRLSRLDLEEITGGISNRETIECYDMAIKYIDENISIFIEAIRDAESPKAFIYFSDHGESVYTGRGHDSSRLQIDMVTVPLILYINKPARKILTKTIKKLNTYKLDYIPYLISEIVGIRIGKYENNGIIMIRNTISGKEHINLNSIKNKSWIFNQYVNSKNPKPKHSCLHRVNNLGKLNQGRLAFKCLEFDVVVTENGNIYVDHDLPTNSNLEASFLIQQTKNNNLSIWIDAKNIDTKQNCLSLSNIINEDRNINKREILIEFPSKSIDNLDEIRECIKLLQFKVNYISYYVPTEELISCQNGNNIECINIISKLKRIQESNIFNSYSFDYKGIDFMMSKKELFPKILYHSWGITDITDEKLSNITMGIVNSKNMLNQN